MQVRLRILLFALFISIISLLLSCSHPAEQTQSPSPAVVDFTQLTSFRTHDFVSSGNCAVCHNQLVDNAGEDISIDAHWRSTMMANAAKDPLWQAKVSTEIAKNPHLRDTIEDVCATCHMPMAHTQAHTDDIESTIFNDGFLDPYNTLHDAAMDGVSCTVCHQIENRGLGQPATFSGGYSINTRTDAPERLIFGPYDDPIGQMMVSFIGFTPVYGQQMANSGLCATCHTLYTPFVDGTGEVQGTFPEQTPFIEWQHSDYGPEGSQYTECQECHMPLADGAVRIANRPTPDELPSREPFHQHYFVGGNATILNVLKENAEALGVTAPEQTMVATLERVVDQLENRTATVTIQSAELFDGTLDIEVQVKPLAGHKFPSGYPSRRVWLHVVGCDSDGNIIFESGAFSSDGSIEGCDADTDAGRFEHHYDLISSPDQVQLYETIMHNTDDEVTYTLLRAAGYVKDNRLLPDGFDSQTSPEDIAVKGAATEDGNFTGGSDTITYSIITQNQKGPFDITVELLYQSLSYQTVQDIIKIDTEAVNQFKLAYAVIDKTPLKIDSAQITVP